MTFILPAQRELVPIPTPVQRVDHSLWVQAHRRILSQDYAYICNWCQQNAISSDIQTVMLTQLKRHCGTETGNREMDELCLREGTCLVQQYTSLAYDDQLQWLIADLSARQATQRRDEQDVQADFRARMERHCQVTAHNVAFSAARMHRARINAEQTQQLLRMLRCQPAPKVDDALRAMQSINILVDWTFESGRTPLATRAPNLPSIPAVPSTQKLKRKREEDVSSNHLAFPWKEDWGDDKDMFQKELDDLQAVLAATVAAERRVETHMPVKKVKAASHSAAKADPSLPQPASHVNHTNATQLSPTPASDVNALPVLISESSATVRDLRLILKRHGSPDYKCRAKSSSSIAKIVAFAKRHFMISSEICIHFEGQRLSAAESLDEAGLPDFAWLQVSDLPMPGQRDAVAGHGLALKIEGKELETSSNKPSAKQAHKIEGKKPKTSSIKPSAKQPVFDLTSSSPVQAQPAPPAPPPLPVQTEPALCQEQQDVVDAILAGKNVFYTGSAGCGKSTVLKAFVPRLRDLGKTVRIVAPTGKAALDINGSTTWTYAGWTPTHMKHSLHDLVKAAHGKFVSKRFRATDVLVIDEISMVENHLLARLNVIMKAARQNDRPFGGVQLVVTGDFCQLPPVKPFAFCMHCGREHLKKIGPRGETLYRCPQHGDCNDDDKWAFRSSVWEECKFKHVNLSNIHRQSDQVFIGILQKLRIGKPLTNADRQLLLDHPCDVKNAVKLFPTREEVRRINQLEFDQLRTAKRDYRCLDYFYWNEQHGNLREKGRRSSPDGSLDALREHRLDSLIEFKAGMLVVLLVNLDITNGLVNGSQGRVIGFEPYAESKLPKAATREGDGYSSFSRGGGSSKKARQRGGGSPEPSQPALQGELRGEYAVLRETQIREFILQPRNQNKMWPIVEFDNGLRRTIYADCQVNELGDEKPYTLLARTQIPLLAAWAMTIHKSQGMTLNKVIVDLGKSFEEGQEYVALSRARSLDGLKVISLGNDIKGGNEQVKQFLKEKFNIG